MEDNFSKVKPKLEKYLEKYFAMQTDAYECIILKRAK